MMMSSRATWKISPTENLPWTIALPSITWEIQAAASVPVLPGTVEIEMDETVEIGIGIEIGIETTGEAEMETSPAVITAGRSRE